MFDVVVIAASRGGRPIIERILALLPADFPTPVVISTHMSQQVPSLLPLLLSRRSICPVRPVEHGKPPCPGVIYVSVPGHHTRIASDGQLLLDQAPKVHFARPCADILFESAAATFGHRTLGVILTGELSDGARGAVAVTRAGGVVLAQAPGTCEASSMPRAAIECDAVHLVLPPDGIATALNALVRAPGVRRILGLGAVA